MTIDDGIDDDDDDDDYDTNSFTKIVLDLVNRLIPWILE